jgi:hypothetical protein
MIDQRPSSDRTSLEWWAGSVMLGKRVKSWMPAVFEDYARILHPAYVQEETPRGVVHHRATWKELAQWSGKLLDSETCIDDLLVRSDGIDWRRNGSPPFEGRLDPTYLRRLLELFAPRTDVSENIWLLVWAGYGDMQSVRRADNEIELNSSWRGSGRTYLLFHAAIGASVDKDAGDPFDKPQQPIARTPNFWWPENRGWFVSTDIDSFSTYVGGSKTLIERVVADDLLEAAHVSLEDPFDPC